MNHSTKITINNNTQGNNRNNILDIFRALALITIFINHNPPTIFESITHKNFGFSDAAEFFVLISGIAVALAYDLKYKANTFRVIVSKAWKRVWILYCAHLFTTFATLAIFYGLAVLFYRPDLYDHFVIRAAIKASHKAFLAIITLRLQLGYNNILPLYMILMFFVPFIMFIARKNFYFLLALSAFIYLLAGVFSIAPYNSLERGVWFFNPLSWQFLFIIGIVVTLYIKDRGKIFKHPFLLFMSFTYLILSFVWVRWNLWNIDITMGLPQTLIGFNKTFLSIPRLLHVMALSYIIILFLQTSKLTCSNAKNPLVILGKHSLMVFVVGTIFSMLGKSLAYIFPGNFLFNHIFFMTGLLVLFALTYTSERLKQSSTKFTINKCR